MENVIVKSPSFSPFNYNELINPKDSECWQVLCGDENHWRLGIFSPDKSSKEELQRLELHTCPEVFVLMEGRISLLLYFEKSKKFEIVELKKGQPLVVDTWHDGFCPDGPYTGRALVVERDQFATKYKKLADW